MTSITSSASITKALADSDHFEVEHRVLRPDGSCVWVQATVRLYLDESGRRVSIGATRDISAQRATGETLAEAERQARALIEFSGDMHNRTRRERGAGVCLAQLRAGDRLPPRGAARRHRPHLFTHPDDRERYDAVTAAVCEHGAAEIEYRFRGPNGRYMWLHVLLRARYDDHGQVVEIVRAVRDISSRKQAEIALDEERRLLNVFLETTPDQVFFKDLSGRFVRISVALAARLGFEDPEDAYRKDRLRRVLR